MRASIVVGIDHNSYVGRGKLYKCLTVLDIIFSSFVIAPLVIVYWCSTWWILMFVKISSYHIVNISLAVVLAFTVLILFTIFQKQIQVR